MARGEGIDFLEYFAPEDERLIRMSHAFIFGVATKGGSMSAQERGMAPQSRSGGGMRQFSRVIVTTRPLAPAGAVICFFWEPIAVTVTVWRPGARPLMSNDPT